MPTPIPPRLTLPPKIVPPTVTVRAGDTLAAIARQVLGDARRWKEIHALNKGVIGNDPSKLRVGQVLRLPRPSGPGRQEPAGPPTPTRPTPPPTRPTPTPTRPTPAPPARPADRDGDGLIDRYDAAPDNPRNRQWSKEASTEFADFVKQRTLKLGLLGVEIDCADLAAKLLSDFCKATGIPNPLGERGEKWQVYTPQRNGGLPNVNGPNYFLPGIGADNLAKGHTKSVNDADGNGVAGWDRQTGQVDVADLRAGDILFYDWEGDGKVNHTINVLDVHADGTVVIAWGTYDNLAEDDEVDWKDLDLAPIEAAVLKPGTEDYERYLGPSNRLWGARRYNVMPDKEPSASIAYVPYVKPVLVEPIATTIAPVGPAPGPDSPPAVQTPPGAEGQTPGAQPVLRTFPLPPPPPIVVEQVFPPPSP